MDGTYKKEVKTGICGLCGGNCLMDVTLENGHVTEVEGNRTLPGGSGHLCVKGAAIKQQIYHPDRVRYPMKRVGERGEGKFERISWEQALGEIAEKMKSVKEEHSAEETMIYVGHPKWFRPQLAEFAVKYGTPHYGTESSTCAYAAMMAAKTCYGKNLRFLMPDVRNCKTWVIWGVNPFYSHVTNAMTIAKAKERGKQLIVVDPRCTPTTECADLHLRPIPGTDGALALGIAYVMITEDLYDKAFVEKYTFGFEEYKEYVMGFSPEKVQEITSVPAEEIRKAAHMMIEGRPTATQVSAAPVVHHINGVQNARAVLLLNALTGCYGVPGGVMAPGPGMGRLDCQFMGAEVVRENADHDFSHEEFPAWAKLISEEQVVRMADYLEGKGGTPIRMLLSFGMNHHMWPRPDRIEKALKNLELFVSIDAFLTDTSKYADLILPSALNFEREQIEILPGNIVYYQPKVIEAEGEIKNDLEILFALAKRLGIELGDCKMDTYEEYLHRILRPTGITLEELKENPKGIPYRGEIKDRTTEMMRTFHTPTGKVEFTSSVLAECDRPGNEPLPVYHDFREKLPLEEYPLLLSTGCRKSQWFHSRTYRIPWLSHLETAAMIDIHPEDALQAGIKDRELVTIETPVGTMDLVVRVDSSCKKGVVNVYHGAGEMDINYLLDDNYLDPVSGFPGYKAYCCRIKKKGAES